ncbi:MAG: thioredoxin family protein [Sphingobium sp.]
MDGTALTAIGKWKLPALVHLRAVWCRPCRTMAPDFSQGATSGLQPHIRLLKFGIEAKQGIAARHDIRSIPTLTLLGSRQEIGAAGRSHGSRTKRRMDDTATRGHPI